MKKMLSAALAVILLVTSISFCTTAYAADPAQCAVISFDGVENNSLIDDAFISINNSRAAKSMQYLQLDYTNTELAKQRAKEIMVYYDANDLLLPNGDSVAAAIPNCITTVFYRFNGIPSQSVIDSYLAADATSSYTQGASSVGIGFFSVGNVTVMYVIFSYAQASVVYQNFADTPARATISTLASNIQLNYTDKIDGKNPRYACSVSAYFPNGCVLEYVPLSLDQLTISSSNPSVAKYKGGYIYPKKNGKYSLTVTLISNPSVSVTRGYEIYGAKNPQATVKSAKSNAKKKLTVKWYNNITDASGYEIMYSTSKKFTKKTTKTVSVKGKNKTSKTISKLKSKKYYYVKVRAYVDQGDGERINGQWSKVVKVKVK